MSVTEISRHKQELRSLMLAQRCSMSADAVEALSFLAQKNILSQPIWQKAKNVALYISTKHEVKTDLLLDDALQTRKTVYLPRTLPNRKGHMGFAICRGRKDLIVGPYNIWEPDPALCPDCTFSDPELCGTEAMKEGTPPPDLFIIPGIAFDIHGQRLGFGGGYYDRFLANQFLRNYSVFVGLAYSFQVRESLPYEPWDQPVDYLATDLQFEKVG